MRQVMLQEGFGDRSLKTGFSDRAIAEARSQNLTGYILERFPVPAPIDSHRQGSRLITDPRSKETSCACWFGGLRTVALTLLH